MKAIPLLGKLRGESIRSGFLPLSRRIVYFLCFQILMLHGSYQALAQYEPYPLSSSAIKERPFVFTGLLLGTFGQGSGAVVGHPKTVISCAHLVYDNTAEERWDSEIKWFGRYHGSTYPSSSLGKALRGYYVFSNYSSRVDTFGQSSPEAFATDLSVQYGYENLAQGGYSGYLKERGGTALLQSSAMKLVAGYPSGLYSSFDKRALLLHATGPFSLPFEQITGKYFAAEGVTTGPGNSGGPIFIAPQGEEYYFAGVVVSGANSSLGSPYDGLGVLGMDTPQWQLFQKVLDELSSSVSLSSYSIEVLGNDTVISPGDTSPSKIDRTNFGTASSRHRAITRKFIIRNHSELDLVLFDSVRVVALGSKGFRLISSPQQVLGPQEQGTFSIQFRPRRKGKYRAVVEVRSSAETEPPYTFFIAGKKN